MSERAKSVMAYAIVQRGSICVDDISTDRAELVRQLNRPAGQRVARVRISEVVEKRPTPRDATTMERRKS